MSIPKIIHQIWLGPNKQPDVWMNSWKYDYINNNPDWEYKLWTEKEINNLNMVNKKQYDFEKFYNGKSDIARYEILNQYGGVFMDADSLWIKDNNISLNTILDKIGNLSCFAAIEPINKSIIANGVIGFIKNNVILNELINFINLNYFKLKKNNKLERDIWRITGTQIFTNIINKYDNKLILDSYYFFPESFHQNNLYINTKDFSKKYPKSIMFQYGYTTNNISNNNIMKKYIANS